MWLIKSWVKVKPQYIGNDQKVELLVRTAETQRNSIQDVRNLIINPNSNSVLRLSDVAEVNVTQGPGKIIRRNQDRVIVVSADYQWYHFGQRQLLRQNVWFLQLTYIHW